MSYLTEVEISKMGFKKVGQNVKISSKASIYNCELIEIGDNSRIDDFCVVSGKIKIGKYVHITPFCLLAGGKLGVIIDNFSTLAYGAYVFTKSDDYLGEYMTNSLIPDRYKGVTEQRVHIKEHVIIGARSLVLPGVVLEQGVSLGANTLVLKQTEPWSVYIGSPAKKLKKRSRALLKHEELFLKEIEEKQI